MQYKKVSSLSRTDETNFSLLVSVFRYLHYCKDYRKFENLLEGSTYSSSYISRIKNVAINCHILVEKGNLVKYRSGLIQPSEKMVKNLLINEVKPTMLRQFSDNSIIRELQYRGYKIEK